MLKMGKQMKKEHHFYTAAINTFMIFFIFCTALSYTEHPMGTTNGKFLVGFLIITCTIFFVDFSKYKWVIPLVAISVLYPLILMVFGIYNFNMLQSIEYLALYVFYLLLVICLSSFYENKVSTFIFIWQVSLTLVLSMLFVFYRGLSFNLSDLLKATITNQRYGTFLTNQRYGMGFLNVNTLALFSMLLILCSCYSLIKKRSRLLSIFDLVFATVLILNTESRTPIVLILVSNAASSE